MISFIIKRRCKKKAKLNIKHHSKLDSILLLPLKFLFFGLGINYCISIISTRFELSEFSIHSKPFVNAYLSLCFAWMAMRWKKNLIHSLQYHPKILTTGLGHTIGKILSILIFVITVLVLLQVFHLNIWPFLAFGGIGAAAVGFAAKDVISNFCGGLMLSLTRPFVVGDQVIIPSISLEGPVEEIGWYLTVIRDKDKRPVYLPNALFSNAIVINSSRMSHRRILDQINIRFSDFDKLEIVNGKIRKYLKEHPSVDSKIQPLVFLNSFKDGNLSIYLDLYVFSTKLADYHQVKDEIYSSIYRIFESEGVKMPVLTLSIANGVS
ncbi:MAG: mechanosensitive ion channel family protein [Chlamydiae bacterium]|nr:mechanosensitive ion channel family protein [Chlamydiota bacterium]